MFLVSSRVFIIGAPRTVRTHGSAAGSATAAAFCEASPVGNATYLVLTVVYCAVLNRPAQNRPSIQVKHAKSWPSSPSPRGQAAKRSTPRLQVDHSPSSTVISGAARRLYHSPRSCQGLSLLVRPRRRLGFPSTPPSPPLPWPRLFCIPYVVPLSSSAVFCSPLQSSRIPLSPSNHSPFVLGSCLAHSAGPSPLSLAYMF